MIPVLLIAVMTGAGCNTQSVANGGRFFPTIKWPAYRDPHPELAPAGTPAPAKRTHYVIDATFKENPAMIVATETITYYNNTAEPLRMLYLRLFPNADPYQWDIGPGGEGGSGAALTPAGRLEIARTTVDDKPVAGDRPDKTTLRLPLGRPLNPGDSVMIRMGFTTVIPRTAGLGRLSSIGDVVELGYWYPLLAVNDKNGWHLDPLLPIGDSVFTEVADFDVSLHLPEGWTGVTTGMREPPAGTVLRVRTLNVRDFGVVLARGWNPPVTMDVDGVQLLVLAPADFSTTKVVQDVAADTLRTFGRLFGAYAYDSLSVLAGVGGTEEPTIAIAAAGGQRTLIHTIAHQWWYAAVGNDKVRAVWDEGLATYSEHLYKEFGRYPESLMPWKLISAQKNPCLNRTLYSFWHQDPTLYVPTEYTGGALWFSDMRSNLGDERFFQTLQRFYAEHKFGTATWDDWRVALKGEYPALESALVCTR